MSHHLVYKLQTVKKISHYKMYANIHGFSDENGSLIFNIPEELEQAGNNIMMIL